MAEQIKYKQEIENIINRLKAAGVQVDEIQKEIADITARYTLLVGEWRVPQGEATRTVLQAMFKKHGIDTKVWASGGAAAPIMVDQIKSDNEWISLKGKIVQIWDNNSDKIAMTGLIGDSTGVIKFTVFAKNTDIIPEGFSEGKSYQLNNFVTSTWQGKLSVKGNKTSKITELTEDIEVSRASETIVGVITSIGSGSGLIKRCPECNRALIKGACGEHGKVQGKFDIRIKAVISKFGTNETMDLIIGTVPTEKLMNLTVDQAKDIAMESMDTATIEDMMVKKLTGKYYTVTGSMMTDSMLVTEITETHPANEESIKNALTEITGGD